MTKDKTITIIVEGTAHDWPKGEGISYEEVVRLEFDDYSEGTVYSVTYKRGGNKGTLAKGGSIKAKDEMIFKVSDTGQS